jgi:hypothetical protein
VLRALDEAGLLQRLLHPDRVADRDAGDHRDDREADDDPDVEGVA